MTIRSILITLCLGWAASLGGQTLQVRFNHLGPKDGLPEGHITGIAQDSQNYIWISSFEGLFRYDGYGLESMGSTSSDSTSISSERILDLHLDSSEGIWAATFRGLDYMDRETGHFRHIYKQHQLMGGNMLEVFEASNGIVWVSGGNGLVCFDPLAESAFHVSIFWKAR